MPPNAQKTLQLQAKLSDNPKIAQLKTFQNQLLNSPKGQQVQQLKAKIAQSPQVQRAIQLQAMANQRFGVVQRMEEEDLLQGKFKQPDSSSSTNDTIQGYFTHYRERVKATHIREIAKWLTARGYDEDDIQTFIDGGTSSAVEGGISTALRFTKMSYAGILAAMALEKKPAKKRGRDRSRSKSKNKRKVQEKKFYDYDSSDELSESEGEEITIKRKNGKEINAKKHSLKTTHNKSKNRIRRMRAGKSTKADKVPLITQIGGRSLEFAPSPWRKDIGVYPARLEDDSYMRDGNAETYDELSKHVDSGAKKAKLETPAMLENVKYLIEHPETGRDKLPHKMDVEEDFAKVAELTGVQVLDYARSQNTYKIAEKEVFNQKGSFRSIYGGKKPTYGGAKNKTKHGEGGVHYLKNTRYDE